MIISFIACSKFPSFLIQHSSPLQALHSCLGISILLPNSILSSKWINCHRFLRINFYHIWYYNFSSFHSSLYFLKHYHFFLCMFSVWAQISILITIFLHLGIISLVLKIKILNVESFVNFKFSYLVSKPFKAICRHGRWYRWWT